MEKTVANSDGFSGEKTDEMEVSDQTSDDHFYNRLEKLTEPSGLSLVFSFRETKIDLHRLYKEVIERGGFHQVTKLGKWDDVASASNSISSLLASASQLQNVYETLLLQFELMDSGKPCPEKTSSGCGVSSSYSKGKRKCLDLDQDGPPDICSRAVASEPKARPNNSSAREFTADLDAPLKPRSGYSIFLRLETHRLKTIYRENSNGLKLRKMLTNAWRCLPEKEKQPYMEASKMDKERYEKEMAAYNKQLQDRSLSANDVYHVSLEYGSGTFYPDKPKVGPTDDFMKNAGGGHLGLPYDATDDWVFY